MLLAAGGERLAPDDLELSIDLNLVLGAATAATTLLLGGLLIGLAPVVGRPTGLYLGMGTALLAVLTLGVSELGPALSSETAVEYGVVRAWTLALVFGLYTLAMTTSRATTRARHLPLALGLVAMGLVVAHQWGIGPPHMLALAWGAMIVAQGAAYVATDRSRHVWVAVALVGFFLSEIGLAAHGASGVWLFGVPLLRIEATALAVTGILADLARTERRHRRELAASWERVWDLQLATLAARRSLEERDHEARSALAAIEFTAHTLRRHSATLNESALTQLELAFTSELALLRRLVTLPEADGLPAAFRVRETLAGIVAAAESRGMVVELDVDPNLTITGQAEVLAEIAQTVLDNARTHAPGSPVEIRGWQAGDYVVVAFDDQGPGIDPLRRRDVFNRGGDGGHATSARGRGLGLYVASRLAREEGGQLWLEASRWGGASFRLSLPAAARAPATGEEIRDDDRRARLPR